MTNTMITPAAASIPDASSASALGFFQRPLPARIILASFFLVTIPTAGALVYTNSHRLLFLYIWIFSATHFVVTFTIYLQSENLRHFTATRRNIIQFVVIPLGIFAIFYFVRVMRVAPRFPMFALLFGAAVRILDFNHFNRQSFGVYQLFKARTGLRAPALCKKIENAYFISLSVLLFITYLAGGVSPWIPRDHLNVIGGMEFLAPMVPVAMLRVAAAACASVSAALLVTDVAMILKSWRESGQPSGLWESFSYVLFQTLSAALAIAFLPLYATALAIHYAEYHVLMYPRCFHSRLDLTRSLDHWYQTLRGSRALFYGMLIAVSGLVTLLTTLSGVWGTAGLDKPVPYLAFVAIFDGIFVCHYFIEMLIWRFSDPFFRTTAAALYIAPRSRT
ncbi:MAG TPA: hypothetical protein VMT15_14865 [Bryobacteraceae bacterium]|nr:hypothetical protein [Bryobacteraceae bacterium]